MLSTIYKLLKIKRGQQCLFINKQYDIHFGISVIDFNCIQANFYSFTKKKFSVSLLRLIYV